MVNEKKIGGIIIDMSSKGETWEHLVLGIGMNVNITIKNLTRKVGLIATSILEESGKRFSLKIVKDEILNSIDEIITDFEQGIFKDKSEEWKQYSYTFGKTIKTEALGDLVEGIESGITESGDLKLIVEGNEEIVSVGDVFLSNK